VFDRGTIIVLKDMAVVVILEEGTIAAEYTCEKAVADMLLMAATEEWKPLENDSLPDEGTTVKADTPPREKIVAT